MDLGVDQLLVSEKGRIQSASTGAGTSGSVSVKAKRILMNTGGSITTEALESSGGEIALAADEAFQMEGAIITAQSMQDGGSVTINTPADLWWVDSTINAEAGQNGGNISLKTPSLLVLENTDLVANSIYGTGGNISLATRLFLPSWDSVISASSEIGLQGSIEIESPETDVGSGLVVLPESLVEQDVNLSDRCALMLGGDVSSFFLNGDGGVPVWSRVSYVPSVFLGDEEGEE